MLIFGPKLTLIMKLQLSTILATLFISTGTLSAQAQQDSLMMRKIYDEELVNGKCYENLHYLCKNIGGRLSGSANAQKAVEWGKNLMEEYGFDSVYLQPVMVPHWVRGEKEKGSIMVGKSTIPVAIAALGGSVATPANGITAEVVEVHNLGELQALGEARVKGKIVFFNGPFDQRYIETMRAYGSTAAQRSMGPALASKLGAVGAIVRSLTGTLDNYPHTGATNYGASKPIPAAAISTLAANQLSDLLKRNGTTVKFYFKQSCQTLPDILSYNVVGELKGSEHSNKIITVGGHLDSWDLAEGAHDDGTGVVQSAEVLRLLKTIGYKPKNTIRAVFFMNEENGDKGGAKYAELAAANNEEHLAAIETDEGGFTPRGFRFDISEKQLLQIKQNWKALFEPFEADLMVTGGSGTDIEPLRNTRPHVVLIGFQPDSQRYFDFHHTPNDVFENVNKRELELGSAAIASLVYLIDEHGL